MLTPLTLTKAEGYLPDPCPSQTAGSWVTLAGVTSGTGHSGPAVDVVEPARRWQVRFDETTLAYPTEVVRYDATGHTPVR